jgi:hypothetical protein
LGRRNVMILGRNRTGTLWYRLRMAKRCSWDVISGYDVSLSSRWICRPTRLSLLVTTWIFWRCALNDLRYCLFQDLRILKVLSLSGVFNTSWAEMLGTSGTPSHQHRGQPVLLDPCAPW